MTRFAQEISGALGAFWRNEAEKEIREIEEDLENGKITIDENGVARNCIGRVLMEDMAEKVEYITSRIDRRATAEARSEEIRKLAQQMASKPRKLSYEERMEMENAFGKGAVVVNVLTGERYRV